MFSPLEKEKWPLHWLAEWFVRPARPARPPGPASRARLALEALEDRLTPSVTIQIDYSHDVNHFFLGHPDRQAALEFAANAIGSQLNDNLAAITPDATPGVGNHWTVDPLDPSNINQTFQVTDLNVPANTIIIFAGGTTTLPSGDTGWGAPGGAWTSSSSAFADTITARGKAPTDFAPWGGTIAFQTTFPPGTFLSGGGWDFGLDPTRTLAPHTMDFVSAAEHEIGHVLGVGTAPSWQNKLSNGFFTGQAAMDEFGNGTPMAIPTDASGKHWQVGVTDNGAPVTMAEQQEVLSRFTALDFAALKDLGWQVTPHVTPLGNSVAEGPNGEVFSIFGSDRALWVLLPNATNWQPIISDVQSISVGSSGVLDVLFTNGHLWQWTQGGGWSTTRLASDVNSVVEGPNGVTFATFGFDQDLRWHDAGGWHRVGATGVKTISAEASGNLDVLFVNGDLWRYSPVPSGASAQPAGWVPSMFLNSGVNAVAAGANGVVFASIGTAQELEMFDGTSWQGVSSFGGLTASGSGIGTVASITVGADGVLDVVFTNGNLWQWFPSTQTWGNQAITSGVSVQ
jgi:hypothetical protein